MYVVGQYPRFLKAHWKFLKTVVNKLFEFMHELHPGVQDMACDTFLKICNKCKRNFVTSQPDEPAPFLCELVTSLPTIISDLEPHQVQAFYEATATMLSDKGPSVRINRKEMLEKLMELPNRTWKMIMERAKTNVETLVEPATIKEVIKILKTNDRVCKAVGSLFTHQLEVFFMDLLNVYKVYSEQISLAIAQQGAIATQMSLFRTMRSAKKEVLRLLIVFIDKSGPPEAEPRAVAQGFIPPVLDPILGDYKRNIAGARDPEVLKLFSTVIEKLRSHVAGDVPRIMEAVFEVTLDMITKNFEDYPEHRIRFFEFIRAVNQHCFQSLFSIPAEHQRLVVHAIVWAMKHTERNISDTVSLYCIDSLFFMFTTIASQKSNKILAGLGNFARVALQRWPYPECRARFLPAISAFSHPRCLRGADGSTTQVWLQDARHFITPDVPPGPNESSHGALV
jgi:exportin-1